MLNRAFQVGSILGITLRVHAVFVLLFVLLLAQTWVVGGIANGVWFASRFLLLFTFVVLHEVGHSLAAQAAGIRVYDIVLWPLGGMARLERIPEDPGTELKIAVAGPAVNVFLVFLLLPLQLAVNGPPSLSPGDVPDGSLLEFAVLANVAMAVFNLIPAFPLDGGRIFRALLARRVPYLPATRAAVHVGRSFAVIAGVAALASVQYLSVAVIALFVWFIGGQELRVAERRALKSPDEVPRFGDVPEIRRPSPGARRFLDLAPPGRHDEPSAGDVELRFRRLLDEYGNRRR